MATRRCDDAGDDVCRVRGALCRGGRFVHTAPFVDARARVQGVRTDASAAGRRARDVRRRGRRRAEDGAEDGARVLRRDDGTRCGGVVRKRIAVMMTTRTRVGRHRR